MRRDLLNKFYRLSLTKKLMCFEAACYLMSARWALAFLPFKFIEAFMNRISKYPEIISDHRPPIITDVVWSIVRVAKHLPGETVCFPRGISAQAMLLRRNISTTLYYGSTSQLGSGLASHVWVKDGDHEVIGCRECSAYKTIAKFPNHCITIK
jgi:hypothetical protein